MYVHDIYHKKLLILHTHVGFTTEKLSLYRSLYYRESYIIIINIHSCTSQSQSYRYCTKVALPFEWQAHTHTCRQTRTKAWLHLGWGLAIEDKSTKLLCACSLSISKSACCITQASSQRCDMAEEQCIRVQCTNR